MGSTLLTNGFNQDSLCEFTFELPIAATANYFSSATDGGGVGSFSCAASISGAEIFRSAQGKKSLHYGRLPAVVKTDASGTTLQVVVVLEGYRLGVFQRETISLIAAGTETVKSTKLFDEISKAYIASIIGNAASDTIQIGFDDSWLGLPFQISSKDAIRSVYKISSATPDANGPKVNTDITDAMVKLEKFGSGIDVKALYAATAIAVTDRYLMKIINNGSQSILNRQGVML